MSHTLNVGVCLVSAALMAGCAAHRQHSAGDTLAPIEGFAEEVRRLSAEAPPPHPNEAGTLESRDRRLSAARLLLALAPTADNQRRVAIEYARLGVLDAAYDHFEAAVRLMPNDAASLDGLARIWRDWGFPHLGLIDAYRAVYYEPHSPVPLNTLGTLLLEMGRVAEARATFERALALDQDAGYVLNNLCHAVRLQGTGAPVGDACRGVSAATSAPRASGSVE